MTYKAELPYSYIVLPYLTQDTGMYFLFSLSSFQMIPYRQYTTWRKTTERIFKFHL